MSKFIFTKENLDKYLLELSKDFRKRNGTKTPAELTIIGGASVIINYGFRELTEDIDAIITASSAMQESINHVSDVFNLPHGWLNVDFMRTTSFTPNIIRFSKYYRTFSNILTVRTISGEHLIAMKLKSGRQYKYDLSDVVGILLEYKKKGEPLTFERIKTAVEDLYNSYDALPDVSKKFIEYALKQGDYEALYKIVRKEEIENKKVLVDFDTKYPGVAKFDNINEIIERAKKKRDVP